MAPLLFKRTINYWAFPLLQLEFVLPFFWFNPQPARQNLAPPGGQTIFAPNVAAVQQTLFNLTVANRPRAERSEQRSSIVAVSREPGFFSPTAPAVLQQIFALRFWLSSVFNAATWQPAYEHELRWISYHPLALSSKSFGPLQQIFKLSAASARAGSKQAPSQESFRASRLETLKFVPAFFRGIAASAAMSQRSAPQSFWLMALLGTGKKSEAHFEEVPSRLSDFPHFPFWRSSAYFAREYEGGKPGDSFPSSTSLFLVHQNFLASQLVHDRMGNAQAARNLGISPAVMRHRRHAGFLPAQIKLVPQSQAVAPARSSDRKFVEQKQTLFFASEVEAVTPGLSTSGGTTIHANRHEIELFFHRTGMPVQMALAHARPFFFRMKAAHAPVSQARAHARGEARKSPPRFSAAEGRAKREQPLFATPVWLAPLLSRVAGPNSSRQLPQNPDATSEIFPPMSLHEFVHGGLKRSRAFESGWQIENTPALTHRVEEKQETSRAGEVIGGSTSQAPAGMRRDETAPPVLFASGYPGIRFGKVAGLAEPPHSNSNMPAEVNRIAEEVYNLLEKKLRTERERRGLFA